MLPFFVCHGKNDSLDKFLDLLVHTSNVAVLLVGPGVNLLHGLHSAVVLAGEGVEDQVEVLGGE